MCDNMVDQWVPKGWDYVNRPVKCGNTLMNGERAVCDECANDEATMRRINRQEECVRLDNEASHSAGWGDW